MIGVGSFLRFSSLKLQDLCFLASWESEMHVDYVGRDLKAYSEHVPFKLMSALKHSVRCIHTHKRMHTHTEITVRKEPILLLSNWVFLTFLTPSYLFLCLFAVLSHPSSALPYGINAGFQSDEMQIFLMVGHLMKAELKLANG